MQLATLRSRIRASPLLSLIVSNVLSLLLVLYAYSRKQGGMWKVSKRLIFKILFSAVSAVPATKALVEKEQADMRKKIIEEVVGDLKLEKHSALPKTGWAKDRLLSTLREWKGLEGAHRDWSKCSGCVYHGGEDLATIMAEAQGMFLLANPLHPAVFPYVRKMEADVVAMTLSLFRAPASGCGTITSGGTESILMAIRAAKVHAQQTRGVVEPEMVIPVTAHAAFDKGCEYFGITLHKIDVDPVTRRAVPSLMAKAINSNTIMIVGSAPCFPSGCVDPIAELSALAKRHRTLLHVDCCLGSFLIAFARLAGHPLPEFDFNLEGVTSISCDTHKFGFSPKGSSVIMYRNPELRHCQYFVCPEWTGGIYASPTIAGSRPGAVSVGTWAAMMHMGYDGYAKSAEKILEATDLVEKGIRGVEGVEVFGTRHLSVIALKTVPFKGPNGSKLAPLNIYSVSDAMGKRGWDLNALQNPPSIHICVTYCNADRATDFVADLADSVTEVREHPERFKGGDAAIYGLAESIPDKSLIADSAKAFIDALFHL